MIQHAAAGRMLPVLDFEPVLAAAWPVDALTVFGQTFKHHTACSLEQLGTDFTLLEGATKTPSARPRSKDGLGAVALQRANILQEHQKIFLRKDPSRNV